MYSEKNSKLLNFLKQDAYCLYNLWGVLLLVLVVAVYVAMLTKT